MTRSLKTFMRNRKAEMLGCGPCECRTLQCWRYANENCGCGENGTSLPNKFKVRENSENLFVTSLFNEDVEQDNIIVVGADEETGGIQTVVGEFLAIEDEDTNRLWRGIRESLDGEAVEKLLGRYDEGNTGVGYFTSKAMAQFNALINNPTEEQAQILREWLEDSASDEYDPPRYPIVTFTQPTLLSYQQVMALANTAARVEELNKSPVEYFNKFTEEGNVVGDHLKDDLFCQWDNSNQEWVEGSR